MLLHSLATSMVNLGMVSLTPSCTTGTPTAAKSTRAAEADPCCRRLTSSFNTACGKGTRKNKKKRGKINDRETLEPKQRTKAPIQESTSATILIESCKSDDIE